MRTITQHVVECDDAPQLTIVVLDEPGHGGANHVYSIRIYYPPGSRDVPLLGGIANVDGCGGITQGSAASRSKTGP